MSTNIYKAGLRNDGSYKVSGQPYIARKVINVGEEVKVEFPYVTKNVTIRIPTPPNSALDNTTFAKRLRTAPLNTPNHTPGVYDLGSGNDFTLAFWFKRNSGGKHTFDLLKTSARDIQIRQVAISPAEYEVIGTGNRVVGVGHAENDWHHLVLTQHTGSVHLYLDGNVNSRVTSAPAWDDIVFPPNNGQRELVIIDEITVWNDGFGVSEYSELYNNGEWYNPNFHSKNANLLTWHTMGDAVGDSVTGDPIINDLAGTNETLHLRSGTGPAGVFTSGPFSSQTTGKVRIHTLSTGSASGANVVGNRHYYELQGYDSSVSLPLKTKEIYLSSVSSQTTVEVIAELTNIPTGSMYALTGSGIDE